MADPSGAALTFTGSFIEHIVNGASLVFQFMVEFLQMISSVMFSGGIYTFIPLAIILIIVVWGALKYALHSAKGVIILIILGIVAAWVLSYFFLASAL